ncbi:MAG: hypothetical protein H6713_23965 [Myxococcales bacterium]|nr:hypothetical protein [Myxococcales bacterium]
MRTDAPNIYRDADLGGGHEVSTVARALELVAENAGLSGSGVAAGARPVTAEDAWQAVANYSATASWTEIAASAARALGLQPYLCEDSLGFDPGELPALARVGEGQWLVVIGRRGRRLTVVQLDERGERRVRLTPTQLRALVGRQPWLLMRPLLALDPIGVARRPVLKDRTWLRLRAFLGLERRELWVVVIYAIVLGGLTLATPIAAQALVNTVAFGAVLQPLVVLTILLLAGLGFAGALGVLEGYVVEVVQRRVFVRIADDFGRRLPSVRGDALDGRYGPELVNRFFDVLTIQKSLAVLLLDGMTLALQTGIGMILLGFYHPLLLAFDFVLIVLLALVLALGRGAVATGLHESSAKYKTAAWLEDLIRAPHLFRGARAQEYAARRTEALCRDYLSARKRHYRLLVRQIAGGYGLQITAMVTLLGVGGWLVIDRQLTLGQLVAAELVIAAIGASFVKLGNNLEKLYDLNVGVLKVASVVDLPTERRGGEPLAPGGPRAWCCATSTSRRAAARWCAARRSSSSPARGCGCAGRRAAARARCSTCSRGCARRRAAACRSTASICGGPISRRRVRSSWSRAGPTSSTAACSTTCG